MAIYRGSESTGTATQVFNIDGDKGDITVTNGGDTWTIDAGVVTTTKLGGDITPQGKALLDDATAAAQRTTLGLGSAAITEASVYATAAQGVKADSAVQPADIVNMLETSDIGVSVQAYSSVLTNTTASFTTADETKLDGIAAGAEVNVNADWNAVSGDALILNKPTLGTAAATNSTAYATAAQGTKADTALQPATIGTSVQAYNANLTTYATVAPTTAGLALLDDINSSAQRTTLGLGTLATQNGTFSGTSSGTNTGDQNLFSTIAVAGQSNVVADATSDTLTLVAGANVTITTDATTDTITISSAGSGGGSLVADGDYGDITVSGTGTVWTIDNGAVTLAKTTGVASSGANTNITSLTGLSGNVSFTGTGNRITGDFSNATLANRVAFQTSTINGATRMTFLPNGTGTDTALNIYNTSDQTNTSFGQFIIDSSGVVALKSSITGTGTYLPMTFYTGGSEKVRIDTSGNVGIGKTPTTLLDVNGTVTATGWAGGGIVTTGTANTFTAQQTFKELKDTVHTITDGAAFEIDPANGSIQTITLGASRTPAATNFEAGQIVLLGIDDGTAYSITWTTVAVTWVKVGGTASAPTLATTGFTWVLLWKVGSTIYGVEVGKP